MRRIDRIQKSKYWFEEDYCEIASPYSFCKICGDVISYNHNGGYYFEDYSRGDICGMCFYKMNVIKDDDDVYMFVSCDEITCCNNHNNYYINAEIDNKYITFVNGI